MTVARLNSFDRGKLFYPLIMNYLTQLIGFKELALRGVAGSASMDIILEQLGGRLKKPKEQLEDLRKPLGELAGPLQLRSESLDGNISVDIDEIAQEIANNGPYLLNFLMVSAGSVLILAHEMSSDWRGQDRSPLWEFLRHCRHAAAHGGKVSFTKDEPRRPAQWGSLVFLSALQGSPLFKQTDRNGMLSPGDPIRLLYDIEQTYPQTCS